ncbi:methylated-DNA--[protein]-cysteine S-methyltransferase [Cryptosporangium phraense]|uniref:methylated-DNA--[protein]-cysteine S-methyltransferase n=1 Tax=Cryptosporangium phraense TaxID=2593070 RepID=UPI00197AD766|nr:methylated-DNA--[protein]-cysteine S-methyltransferase [Cryptosporangium phraense]
MTDNARVDVETCASVEIPTPIGPLGVVVTARGVLAVGLGGLTSAEQAARSLNGLVPGSLPGPVERVRGELGEYFEGMRQAFTVPIDWRLSSGYALEVRRMLAETVAYGDTISYSGLARLVRDEDVEGRDGAARAVGRAMATNPVPLLVPCHRVLAADGSLHGFGGGLEMKRRLLALEGAVPATLF